MLQTKHICMKSELLLIIILFLGMIMGCEPNKTQAKENTESTLGNSETDQVRQKKEFEEVLQRVGEVNVTRAIISLGYENEALGKVYKSAGKAIDEFEENISRGFSMPSDARKNYRITKELRLLIREVLVFQERKETDFRSIQEASKYISEVEDNIATYKKIKLLIEEYKA